MGERVWRKRAAAPLSSEPLKHRVDDGSTMSWHSIWWLHLGSPLAGPAQMPAVLEMDSTAALRDYLATLHHPMASVALGCALHPMGTTGWAVSTIPIPTSSLCDRETRRAEALAGVKGLAVTFQKNPCQTIPVVGTAFSKTQMCSLFISAMVLSCFIKNRLVLERDRMGTGAVITLLLLWGCHKNSSVCSRYSQRPTVKQISNTLPSIASGHCFRMTGIIQK